jgi:hypothetical protein
LEVGGGINDRHYWRFLPPLTSHLAPRASRLQLPLTRHQAHALCRQTKAETAKGHFPSLIVLVAYEALAGADLFELLGGELEQLEVAVA